MFGNGFFSRSQARTVVCNGFLSRSQACVQSFGSSVQTADAALDFDKSAVRLCFSVHVCFVCFCSDIISVFVCLFGYFIQFGFFCFCSDIISVFLDGFGQTFKALVVFNHDFFQTLTFKVVGFNIGISCWFFGNFASFFINVVDVFSGFETVDFLGIVDCCGSHQCQVVFGVFYIGTDFIDNLGGFYQCFTVFLDGFGQLTKALVVLSHDFFQTQTFKVVVIDIFLGCFFMGYFVGLGIGSVYVVIYFETVDVLGIFVGSN